MHLIVIRHAIAQERRPGLADSRRALTPRGRRRMRQAVRGLERLGLAFDRIHASPFRRAAQTAELLLPLVRGPAPQARRCPELARAPSPGLLAELRGSSRGPPRGKPRGKSRAECVAVVGHEPWTGELLAWLLLGHPQGAAAFALKKGGVAWLCGELEPGGMRLVALLPPRLLRRVGAG